MHLNGSTEVELSWREALEKPDKFRSEAKDVFKEKLACEQFLQDDLNLTPTEFFNNLFYAQELRKTLVGTSIKNENNHLPSSLAGRLTALMKEALFLIRVFDKLETYRAELVAYNFYYYLLLQSQFSRLLIQQKDQWGFDQFQKITVNQLRNQSERCFKHRFSQLSYTKSGDLDLLEGRINPGKNIEKIEARIKDVLGGYFAFSQPNTRPPKSLKTLLLKLTDPSIPTDRKLKISILFHFIKYKDKRLKDIIDDKMSLDTWAGRFSANRNEYEKTRRHFMNLRRGIGPLLDRFVVGFDAAANELHTPPEVFAPVFARLRDSGYQNFTYHAGEDFIHLLSGIRTVYEAITFCDLT